MLKPTQRITLAAPCRSFQTALPHFWRHSSMFFVSLAFLSSSCAEDVFLSWWRPCWQKGLKRTINPEFCASNDPKISQDISSDISWDYLCKWSQDIPRNSTKRSISNSSKYVRYRSVPNFAHRSAVDQWALVLWATGNQPQSLSAAWGVLYRHVLFGIKPLLSEIMFVRPLFEPHPSPHLRAKRRTCPSTRWNVRVVNIGIPMKHGELKCK